jgi:hypothetical protein
MSANKRITNAQLPLLLPLDGVAAVKRLTEAELTAAWRAFYAVYPRHKAPDDGLKAFKTVLMSGRATLAHLMRAVQVFADECAARGREKELIPYPATWIRRGQFDDEIEGPGTTDDRQDARRRQSPAAAQHTAFARARAAFGGGVR